jgi:hypothetical protein
MLRRYYRMNLPLAVRTVYPEHDWVEWNFKRTVSGFWDDPKNQKRFFKWFEERNGIKSFDDWYQFSANDVITGGGSHSDS